MTASSKIERKPKVNKTRLIAELMASGLAKPQDIQAALKERYGIDASTNVIGTTKSKLKSRNLIPKMNGDSPGAEALGRCIEFIHAVGGVEQAKTALDYAISALTSINR